MYLFYHMREML